MIARQVMAKDGTTRWLEGDDFQLGPCEQDATKRVLRDGSGKKGFVIDTSERSVLEVKSDVYDRYEW